jgi:predicted nucleic acid-binding Zn ribbon protein
MDAWERRHVKADYEKQRARDRTAIGKCPHCEQKIDPPLQVPSVADHEVMVEADRRHAYNLIWMSMIAFAVIFGAAVLTYIIAF